MRSFFNQYWPQILAGATLALCGFVYRVLSRRISRAVKVQADAEAKAAHDQKCMYDGTQALLRNEIIKSYNEYITRGCIPIYAMENVLVMYDAYHGLGGNGTITKLINELDALSSAQKVIKCSSG